MGERKTTKNPLLGVPFGTCPKKWFTEVDMKQAEERVAARHVTLGEILTDQQLARMMETIKDLERRGIKPIDLEYTKALKELFAPWRVELAAKGVNDVYLAYLITGLVHQGKLK